MEALTLTSITDWSADRSKPPAMVDMYMCHPPPPLVLSTETLHATLPYPVQNFVGSSYAR